MTETYIAPPSGAPNATLARDQVLDALAEVTLQQSMFDNTSIPDRVCAALEGLGWKVDEENTG